MILYTDNDKNSTTKRTKYIGQMFNDLPEGKGIMYYKNGDNYEGEWKNDNRERKGIMLYSNVMDMKANGKMIKKKEKEFFIGMMVLYI